MAMMPPPSRILRLDSRRCLVVPSGGWYTTNGLGEIVDWSDDCTLTVDGYDPSAPPLWPGARPEQLHPFPLE